MKFLLLIKKNLDFKSSEINTQKSTHSVLKTPKINIHSVLIQKIQKKIPNRLHLQQTQKLTQKKSTQQTRNLQIPQYPFGFSLKISVPSRCFLPKSIKRPTKNQNSTSGEEKFTSKEPICSSIGLLYSFSPGSALPLSWSPLFRSLPGSLKSLDLSQFLGVRTEERERIRKGKR